MKLKQLISKRKAPSQARSEQTVEAIYEATAQLLERGDEPSTNRIAERAGVSIGTIYQYFPNATAILSAIAEREQRRIADRLRTALAEFDPATPEASIRLAVRVLIDAFDRRQRLRRRVIQTLMSHQLQRMQTSFLDGLTGELLAIVEARAAGSIRPLSPVSTFVLSRALIGAIRSALVEEAHDIFSPDFEDELVRLVSGFVIARDDGSDNDG